MEIDYILEQIEESIKELKGLLTFEIDGKKISNISKLPFKVVTLIFSLHHRAVDLAKNACSLYNEKQYLSSAIIIRSLMETTAVAFVVQKKIKQVVDSGEIGEIDDFLMRSIFGTKLKGDEIQPYNILTAIDHTDKTHEKYRKMYDEISEFVHPNWFGVAGIYSKNEFNGKVKFGVNINVDEKKRQRILLSFLTAIAVILITFHDLSKIFDDFIKLAEKDINESTD